MSSTTIKKYKRDTDVKIIWCKTICLGKIAWSGKRKINSVDIETMLEYNKKQNKYIFTSSAEVWNASHTDIVSGGQCLDEIWKYTRIKPFDKVYKWWKVYHLNDMHAGTKEQEKCLEEHKSEIKDLINRGICLDKYEAEKQILLWDGLYTVEYEGQPYAYGHGWIYYPIPQKDLDDIIQYLEEE